MHKIEAWNCSSWLQIITHSQLNHNVALIGTQPKARTSLQVLQITTHFISLRGILIDWMLSIYFEWHVRHEKLWSFISLLWFSTVWYLQTFCPRFVPEAPTRDMKAQKANINVFKETSFLVLLPYDKTNKTNRKKNCTIALGCFAIVFKDW